MSGPTPPALAFDHVSKRYETEGGAHRAAVDDVTFALPAGATVAIVGRSGSGKSTLLHLAAGLDVPTSGEVRLAGRPLAALPEADRARLRRERIGFVFQFFHLLPHLSVAENVALPELIAGTPPNGYADRVAALLARVDLADRADSGVHELSGGERQRVAICRALVRHPALVLADEPTGSLDDETGDQVIALLLELTRDEGGTLLYVTHSQRLASFADAVWRLRDGRLDRTAADA